MNLATLSQLGAGGVVAIIAALYAFAKVVSWITKVNSDRERQREDRERQKEEAKMQEERQREDRERQEERQKEEAKRLEAEAERQREDTRRLQVDAEKRRKLAAKLRADNKHFKAFMVDVRATMADVRDKLENINFTLGELGAKKSTIDDSQSPRRLNDFGREISNAFGAKAWAEAHKSDVREKVVGKSAYDIQQFCFDYVTRDTLTKEELQRAKDITYDNGTIISHVLRVLAYELRDCLLMQEGIDVP